jgi:hypothetical protein
MSRCQNTNTRDRVPVYVLFATHAIMWPEIAGELGSTLVLFVPRAISSKIESIDSKSRPIFPDFQASVLQGRFVFAYSYLLHVYTVHLQIGVAW